MSIQDEINRYYELRSQREELESHVEPAIADKMAMEMGSLRKRALSLPNGQQRLAEVEPLVSAYEQYENAVVEGNSEKAAEATRNIVSSPLHAALESLKEDCPPEKDTDNAGTRLSNVTDEMQQMIPEELESECFQIIAFAGQNRCLSLREASEKYREDKNRQIVLDAIREREEAEAAALAAAEEKAAKKEHRKETAKQVAKTAAAAYVAKKVADKTADYIVDIARRSRQ